MANELGKALRDGTFPMRTKHGTIVHLAIEDVVGFLPAGDSSTQWVVRLIPFINDGQDGLGADGFVRARDRSGELMRWSQDEVVGLIPVVTGAGRPTIQVLVRLQPVPGTVHHNVCEWQKAWAAWAQAVNSDLDNGPPRGGIDVDNAPDADPVPSEAKVKRL